MDRDEGFSLVELMVVVAIVALLAALAVPAYARYTDRARRADGKALLLHIAQAEERHYAVHHHYGDLRAIGFSSANEAASEAGHYQAQAVVGDEQGDDQSYVITATGLGTQANDACGSLSIDSEGHRLPSSSDASRNRNGRCW